MTRPKRIWRAGRALVFAAFVLAVLIIPSAQATPGALDPSFGTAGKVTTAISSSDDQAYALAVQPDGKLVAAGYSDSGSTYAIELARYNRNGSLDTSFNGTGKVTTAIGSSDDEVYALALQPDGKLVAAGYSYNGAHYDLALVRYKPDGSLDTTFNGTGKVTTAFGSNDSGANALVVQPDGKLVAAGWSHNGSDYDFALTRYNPDGSLDTSLNGTGKVTTPIGVGWDSANALVLQPDGKLVAVGVSRNGSDQDVALVRYNADGSLDTNFNGTGKVTTPIGAGWDSANALVLQPDGKLVAAGSSYQGAVTNNDAALVRYNPNGSLDTSFNGSGKVTTPIGSADNGAFALALQPDGKLLAAGRSWSGSGYDFALARYNPNGSLDTSFNGSGKVTTVMGAGSDNANAIALQPDGKPVVAGYSHNGSKFNFALARYLGHSTLTVGRTGSGTGSVTSSPNGVSCGPTCSASFAGGPVKLTAIAAAGSSFVGWSGACSGSGTCTVAMGSDRAVTARFESDKALTLTEAGNGVGAVTSNPAGISCGAVCAHTFKYGTVLTLSAAATPRSLFRGWSGACSGTAACTVTMSAARSVTATFAARCIVPKAKGKALRAAKRVVIKAHCSVGKLKKAFSASVKKGRVIAQSAKPGKKLAPGAKVRLTVSSGKKR
jgi:uncharacterized delta-60 repeat protein